MSATETVHLNIDALIDKLWALTERPLNAKVLTISELYAVIAAAERLFMSQPVFLELVPPVVVCGDTHGQFFDLLRIFEACGDPWTTNYLFLGDYVDRGQYSVNTISLLLLYKIKYPENFFMLRGNHEAAPINRMYGFFDECKRDYSTRVWEKFNEMFEWLPITAMIDNRILCVHGGIGPDLHSLDQLRSIKRPLDIPEAGLECDLTWADPEPNCECWGQSPRYISCIFGERPVRQLLDDLGLDTMFRAHQAIARGYQFAFEPWQGVVTVFSAPNYGGELYSSTAITSAYSRLSSPSLWLSSSHSSRGRKGPKQEPTRQTISTSLSGDSATGNRPEGIHLCIARKRRFCIFLISRRRRVLCHAAQLKLQKDSTIECVCQKIM
jgi:serine/threonine-protein phosphatase PP1 catalytic subunit